MPFLQWHVCCFDHFSSSANLSVLNTTWHHMVSNLHSVSCPLVSSVITSCETHLCVNRSRWAWSPENRWHWVGVGQREHVWVLPSELRPGKLASPHHPVRCRPWGKPNILWWTLSRVAFSIRVTLQVIQPLCVSHAWNTGYSGGKQSSDYWWCI